MSGGLAFGSGFNAAAAGGAPNPFKPNAAAPAAPAAPNPFAPAAAGGAAKPANPFAPAAAAAPAAGAAPNPFAPPAANGAAAPAAANGFAPTNAGAFAFQPPAATAAGAAAPANPFAPPAAGGAAAANPFKPAAATAGAANPFAPPATAAAQANPFVSTVSPSLLTSANAGDEVAQQLIQVRKSYDRGDPKSRFQLIFYNKANPAIMSRVVRPPQANPRLWEQAIINNPSPTTLVPCLVTGFEDLERRIGVQHTAKQRYQELLLLLEAKTKEIQQQQEHTVRAEIEQVTATHLEQSHRLLRLMSLIEMTQSADLPLNDAEIDYRRKLETVYKELQKQVARQRKLSELAEALRMSGRGSGDSSLPRSLDFQSQERLYQYLDSQGDYLEQLAREVSLAKSDVTVVRKGLGSHLDM